MPTSSAPADIVVHSRWRSPTLAVLRDPIRNLLSLYTPLSAGDVVLPWEDPFDCRRVSPGSDPG